MGKLTNKVALISGGATGMGGAASRLFAAEGAKVGIVDINAKAGLEAVADIERAGGTACFVQADVSKADEVNKAVDEVSARLGPITVLFNHAGSIVIKPFLETTRGGVGQAHRHQRQEHVPRHQGRPAADDRGGRRCHRLHLVDLGGGGNPHGGALRHDQGRLPHVRPRHRGGVP